MGASGVSRRNYGGDTWGRLCSTIPRKYCSNVPEPREELDVANE